MAVTSSGGGFILSSLPLFPLAYITQHLVSSSSSTNDVAVPLQYHGLHIWTGSSSALATSPSSLMILHGHHPVSQSSSSIIDTSILLQRYQNKGMHFLSDGLTENIGWAAIALNMSSSTLMLATDAYASKPVFIASGEIFLTSSSEEGGSARTNSNKKRRGGGGGTKEEKTCSSSVGSKKKKHFAISSHRSALLRQGFEPSSIQMLEPGTICVYTLPSSSSSSSSSLVEGGGVTGWGEMTESYRLNLKSFSRMATNKPSKKKKKKGNDDDDHNDDDGLSVYITTLKQMLSRVIRDPRWQPAKTTRPISSSSSIRYFMFLVRSSRNQDIESLVQEELIFQALSSLPFCCYIYILDPSSSSSAPPVLCRLTYQGKMMREQVMIEMETTLATSSLLKHTEPMAWSLTSSQSILYQALAAACVDAAPKGVRLYLSSSSEFHLPKAGPNRKQTSSSSWWLALEEYLVQATLFNACGVVHPYLSPQLTHVYHHHLNVSDQHKLYHHHMVMNGMGKILLQKAPEPLLVMPRQEEEVEKMMVVKGGKKEEEEEEDYPERQQKEEMMTTMEETPELLNVLQWVYVARDQGLYDAAIMELLNLLGSGRHLLSTQAQRANITAEVAITYELQGRMVDSIRWYRHAVDMNPHLHTAYANYARMFLGPEMIFISIPEASKREEVIRLLRQQIRRPPSPHSSSSSSAKREIEEGEGRRRRRKGREEVVDGWNPKWYELSLYALGAALYYNGQQEEAQEIYHQLIHLPTSNDDDASRPFSSRRSSKEGQQLQHNKSSVPPPPPLKVISVASDHSKTEIQNLKRSAELAGVNLTILGEGVDYTGHEVKLRLYHHFLEHEMDEKEDDQLVMMTDAYDVLLFPTLATKAQETFETAFTKPIVFSAERACWPDEGVSLLYHHMRNRSASHHQQRLRLPYLNSGAFVGRRRDLLKMVREVMTYPARFRSDQRLFTRYYLEHPEMVELDHDSLLFYSLHSTTTPLVFDPTQHGQVYIMDTVEPCPGVIHANAGDGKYAYQPMVEAWKQATTSPSALMTYDHQLNNTKLDGIARESMSMSMGTMMRPSIAVNSPYFRGIAHHHAGEDILALANFLVYTSTSSPSTSPSPYAPYAAEACYNTGYVLHSLGYPHLARLYYMRAAMVGLLLEQQQQGDNDDDKAHPGGGKGLSSSPKGVNIAETSINNLVVIEIDQGPDLANGALRAINKGIKQHTADISPHRHAILSSLKTKLMSTYDSVYGEDAANGKGPNDGAGLAPYQQIWEDAYAGQGGGGRGRQQEVALEWVSHALADVVDDKVEKKKESMRANLLKVLEVDHDLDTILRHSSYMQSSELLCLLLKNQQQQGDGGMMKMKKKKKKKKKDMKLGLMEFVQTSEMMEAGDVEGLCQMLYVEEKEEGNKPRRRDGINDNRKIDEIAAGSK